MILKMVSGGRRLTLNETAKKKYSKVRKLRTKCITCFNGGDKSPPSGFKCNLIYKISNNVLLFMGGWCLSLHQFC